MKNVPLEGTFLRDPDARKRIGTLFGAFLGSSPKKATNLAGTPRQLGPVTSSHVLASVHLELTGVNPCNLLGAKCS